MPPSEPPPKENLASSTKKRKSTPTANPSSKKVNLKLKIDQKPPADSKARNAKIVRSLAKRTSPSKPGPKSTPARRSRRGRPRNSSLIAAAAAAAQESSIEDNTKPQDITDHIPTIADFRPISLLSFPSFLPAVKPTVSNATSTGTATQPRQLQLNIPKRCAGCGVPAPLMPSNDVHNCTAAIGTISPPHTPLWNRLHPQLKRFVNMETGSLVEQGIIRSGPVPNTVGFWYDRTLGEMAQDSDDVDFKMLCLNLVRWRSENDFTALEGVRVCTGNDGQEGGGKSGAWSVLLEDVVQKGKMWRKMRRQREMEYKQVAQWVAWEHEYRRESRGEYVEDQVGAWVLHAPGVDGGVRKVFNLGYKRQGKLVLVDEVVVRAEEDEQCIGVQRNQDVVQSRVGELVDSALTKKEQEDANC